MSWGGILTAALILAAAQTLTSASADSKSGASGVLSYPASLAANWLDASVPLVPQRKTATTATATAAAPIELATLGQAT